MAFQAEMLSFIQSAQSLYIQGKPVREVFEGLLDGVLKISHSTFGFIGEVLYTEEQTPYLKTYAISNIAWNDETKKFYEENVPDGMEFRNLDLPCFGFRPEAGVGKFTYFFS